MSKLKILGAVAVLVMSGIAWTWGAQSGSGIAPLTGTDYAEIMNLYARYNQGSDFQDPELFLSAFSDTATIVRADGSSITGMAALRKEREDRYRNGRTGDSGLRHRTGSQLITPTPEGATGVAYYALLDVTTSPATIRFTGNYADDFVKTANGWKIQTRTINRDTPRD